MAVLRARVRASRACGRVEYARASGAGGRSAHAAKKVSHGAAFGEQVLSAALRSGSAPSAAASLLRICLGLPPNSPRFGAASPARGGGESQRFCFCSASESSWAAGEMLMGVGSQAWLSAPAAGLFAQARCCPTARVSQKSQRARACWRGSLGGHVAKLPGPGCGQVSAANLLGRAEKFATAQRCKHRSAW